MHYQITYTPRPSLEAYKVRFAIDGAAGAIGFEPILEFEHKECRVWAWRFSSLAQAIEGYNSLPLLAKGFRLQLPQPGRLKFEYVEYNSELWLMGFRTRNAEGVYKSYKDLPVPEATQGYFALNHDGKMKLFAHMSKEHVLHAVGETYIKHIPKEGRPLGNPESFTETFDSQRSKGRRWIDQSSHDLIQTHNATNPERSEKIKDIIRDILEMRQVKFRMNGQKLITG